jgi:type I restriction enzyme S subunit
MIKQEDLPEDWSVENIEDVSVEMDTGSTPSRSNENFWNGSVKWAKAGEISSAGKYINDTEEYVTTQSNQNTYGSEYVFVTIIGSNLSSVVLPTAEMGINQQNVAIRLRDDIGREYFYYYIKSISDYLESLGRGGGQQAINQTVLGDITIPVPSLNEQEQIVEAVEERLERVERLEKSVENLGRLQKEYEDSLLSYLLTGRDLNQEEIPESEDWFGQIPKNWEIKRLEEIGSRVSSMTEPESGSKYSIYSFDSVDDGSGYYEVDGEDIGSRKRNLNGGEVMISRLNPRINRVQKVDPDHKYPPIASSEFVAIDIEGYVSREYLYEYLRNPILQERLTNHVTGSTGSRSRVGFDFVMESNIPVPPKSEQEEIVDNIRKVGFDVLNKSYSDVSKLFDEYRSSVLSHAFRGEVT